MPYQFPEEMFTSVIGGLSIIDVPRLRLKSEQEAIVFAKSYGYDLLNEKDMNEVLRLFRLAKVFLIDELQIVPTDIPKEFHEIKKKEEVLQILIWASSKERHTLQIWSCAFLRVIHILNHLRNGPYRTFYEDIQEQIFELYYGHIYKNSNQESVLGKDPKTCIPLYGFEIKKYKTKSSAAVKLLAKKNEYAMNVLDRLGVRFITHSVFDAFKVLQYLIDQHLVSVPNVVPDQSKNTLYPLNVFFDVMDKMNVLERDHSKEEIDALLIKSLEKLSDEDKGYLIKTNNFSGDSYRAIKFIARQMVTIPMGKKSFRFFFPYEVQIVDYKSHLLNTTGESAHNEYKLRQKEAAKARVMGENLK